MNESIIKAFFKFYRLNQKLIARFVGALALILIVVVSGFAINEVRTNNSLNTNLTEVDIDENESIVSEKIATSGASISIFNEKTASPSPSLFPSPSLIPTPQPTPRPTLLPASAAATPWLTSETASPSVKPSVKPATKSPVLTPTVQPSALPTPTLQPSIVQVATPSVKPVVKEETKGATQTAHSSREYIVQKGDTLFKIAEKELGLGTRYTELAKLNKLKSADHIEVGQVLSLNDKQSLENKQAADQVITNNSEGKITSGVTTGKTYTVQKGDTLWAIAQNQLADPYAWVELYTANKAIIGANPNLIYPGTVLQIPLDR